MRRIKHNIEDRHRVRAVSDEREAWFINEVMDQFRFNVSPTQKHVHKKDSGISLIRDLMLFEQITISSECKNHIKEIQEYARDSKGNIPKRNDHSIDCLRYGLGFNNYTVVTHSYAKKKIQVLPGHWDEVPYSDSDDGIDIGLDYDWDW